MAFAQVLEFAVLAHFGRWWTTNPVARRMDIALSDGALYRIYCEPRGWFVEGSYD